MKFKFTRIFEDETVTLISENLNDFRKFCHYSSLSDWVKHKKLIKNCLEKSGKYVFDGNDVKYYIHLEK